VCKSLRMLATSFRVLTLSSSVFCFFLRLVGMATNLVEVNEQFGIEEKRRGSLKRLRWPSRAFAARAKNFSRFHPGQIGVLVSVELNRIGLSEHFCGTHCLRNSIIFNCWYICMAATLESSRDAVVFRCLYAFIHPSRVGDVLGRKPTLVVRSRMTMYP